MKPGIAVLVFSGLNYVLFIVAGLTISELGALNWMKAFETEGWEHE